MKYPVNLPQLTETMEDATITKWYKAPGEQIRKRENLYQVETDKSTMDIESVDAGFICAILVGEGQTVKVGQQIAVLADAMGEC
jgi:pyruvate/2-oxoglutarate dehydrogenase complex dihydrolipoamide acyltransferase (E2) component